jgi:hypothetical protein
MGWQRARQGFKYHTQANLRNQALTDKAHGCGTRNVEFFRLNPNPELFAMRHSQEAGEGDDWRCRTLHALESRKNQRGQGKALARRSRPAQPGADKC